MTALQRNINRITGVSGAGARARTSNAIKRDARNRARRISNGGKGG